MKQKKLMILGGSVYVIPVIEKAHELGVHVITVDYLPNNVAHQYSDEYHNVSIIDKEAVLTLAKELQIDGITAFVNDVAVVTAAYVAEKMELNFQCPYDSAVILQDKGKFRSFLEENHFHVPHSRCYSEAAHAMNDVDYFCWPVIVKPTDSCGSRGVTKVEKIDDLPSAIAKALESSRNRHFIIEDFISFKGYHSSADSFTIHGELVFNVYSDQLFEKNAGNPYAPVEIIWPTTMEQIHQDNLTAELQRLMRLLNMKHGIYNIETCVGNDGREYIMEVSPRGGGLRIAEIQKRAYGVDLIENEVRQALDMPLLPVVPKAVNGTWCELVVYSRRNESFVYNGYQIDKKIEEKYVKHVDVQKQIGDMVEPFIGCGNIFLHCATREELDDIVAHFSDWFTFES